MEISLTQGKTTIINDIDQDLTKIKWYITCSHNNRNLYAARMSPNHGKTILIHRVILERMLGRPLSKGEQVDHINHDGLDNRRENLRLTTIQENNHNQQIHKNFNKTSIYKGVSWHKKNKIWVCYIRFQGKRIHIGCFKDELQAAVSYNKNAVKYFGEYACLNIIEESQ